MFFAHTLFRVITPFREVTWSDFLLADVLTSLAKPLSDAERAVCHLLTGPVMLPASTAQVGSAPPRLWGCDGQLGRLELQADGHPCWTLALTHSRRLS